MTDTGYAPGLEPITRQASCSSVAGTKLSLLVTQLTDRTRPVELAWDGEVRRLTPDQARVLAALLLAAAAGRLGSQ